MSKRLSVFYIDSGASELTRLKDELHAIQSRHSMAAVVYGNRATLTELDTIAAEVEADILHISGHFGQPKEGADFGFSLGSEWLLVDEIYSIANAIGADLVFLNGCLTVVIADELIRRGVSAVISTTHRATIKDHNAWSFSNYYYSELAQNGGEIEDAYKRHRNSFYAWDSNGAFERAQITKALEPLLKKFEGVEERAAKRERQTAEQEKRVAEIVDQIQSQSMVQRWVVGLVTTETVTTAIWILSGIQL